MRWSLPLLCIALFRACHSQILTSELTDDGETSPSAEEVANRTYSEQQSALQRRILQGYNRRLRPVRNQSTPISVSVHVYIMHISGEGYCFCPRVALLSQALHCLVDQLQQTLSVNGHLYMVGSKR